MRAGPIVIFHVRQQQVTEVALVEHNDVVEAFPADRYAMTGFETSRETAQIEGDNALFRLLSAGLDK